MSTHFQTTCTRVSKDGKVDHFTEGYYKPKTDTDDIRNEPIDTVEYFGGTDAEFDAARHALDGWYDQTPVSVIVHHNGGYDIMAWYPVPAPKPSLIERLVDRITSHSTKVEVSA